VYGLTPLGPTREGPPATPRERAEDHRAEVDRANRRDDERDHDARSDARGDECGNERGDDRGDG